MKQHPFLLVFLLALALAVPYAVLEGPVELRWVVARSVGAAPFPALAGWLTLWRHKGQLELALQATCVAAAILFGIGLAY